MVRKITRWLLKSTHEWHPSLLKDGDSTLDLARHFALTANRTLSTSSWWAAISFLPPSPPGWSNACRWTMTVKWPKGKQMGRKSEWWVNHRGTPPLHTPTPQWSRGRSLHPYRVVHMDAAWDDRTAQGPLSEDSHWWWISTDLKLPFISLILTLSSSCLYCTICSVVRYPTPTDQ
jgi:hypothetical protein